MLDVETTGLNPNKDEIIELAMVLFRFDASGRIAHETVEEYTALREPLIPIPPAATRVHGLTDADVAGHRLDRQRIHFLAAQAEYVIAHNVSFDRAFVERLFPEFFRNATWLCTMRDVQWRSLGLASRSLGAIARHFRIRHENAHRALGDARTTFALLSLEGPQGDTVLLQLLRRHSQRWASAR